MEQCRALATDTAIMKFTNYGIPSGGTSGMINTLRRLCSLLEWLEQSLPHGFSASKDGGIQRRTKISLQSIPRRPLMSSVKMLSSWATFQTYKCTAWSLLDPNQGMVFHRKFRVDQSQGLNSSTTLLPTMATPA